MNFSLTDEQILLRNSARDFLTQEWPSAELRRMLDAEDAAAAADAIWSKIVELGWPGLLVAEEHEGLGLGNFDLAVLMEEAGRRLIPGGLLSSGVLAALALEHLGSEEAKAAYLPKIAEGEIRATLGIYEQGSGWTVMMLQPQTGDTVTKRHVPEAAGADLILCVNRTGGNSVELVVAKDASVTNLGSMDVTRPTFEVSYQAAASEKIGAGTVGDLQAVIDKSTIALAAEMVGGVADVLDQTVSYIKQRKQFGRSVATFQAVQHKAADILIDLERARTAVYYAAAVADEEPEKLAKAASMAKAAANQAYTEGSKKAIQLHGGIGFAWEQDLHLYLRRAKSCEYIFGDTNWHLDRLAHGLGI